MKDAKGESWYKNKKFWFIVSLLPYAATIIYSTIITLDKGLERHLSTILFDILCGSVEVFADWFFNPLFLIVLTGFIFQLWYIMQSKIKIGRVSIKNILVFISMACWALYFIYPIYAYFFGYKFGILTSKTTYGFEAVRDSLFWNLIIYSVTPILPIALIIIIIWFARRKKY